MKTTPLAAAIKRLDKWTRWQQHDHSVPISRSELDNPYAREKGHNHIEDVVLVLRALSLLDAADYVDDRDAEPVFEVRPACSWANASGRKELIHCVGVALVNEDLPDGAFFQ